VTPLASALATATHRLVDTVDSLADERYVEPSLLPDWTIGHVVAHLALNAEAITHVLQEVRAGGTPTMYPSQAARDAEIEGLAADGPEELRTRLSVGAAFLAEEVAVLDPRDDDATFERTPGGTVLRVGVLPHLRLREVEIHHADLGVGYTHRDWPTDTVVGFLERASRSYTGTPFTAHASDLDRSWEFGGGGPVVSGQASALAWWTTGRSAEDLTAAGELPRIEGR
jgi:maleylpyruvate isomerase